MTAYSTATLALSPLLYTQLEQTGVQNPVDSSASARTCTIAGSYTWGATGPVGTVNALTLAGGYYSTDYITAPNSKTLICWVKTTQSDSTNVYAGDAGATIFGDTSGLVWESFGLHGGCPRYTRFNGSTWETVTSPTTVNDGAWHMVAASYNHSTREVVLYIDGAADGGGTITVHSSGSGFDVIGRGYSASDAYLGDLDEVTVFDTVINGANISNLYTLGTTSPPASQTILAGVATSTSAAQGPVSITAPIPSQTITAGVATSTALATGPTDIYLFGAVILPGVAVSASVAYGPSYMAVSQDILAGVAVSAPSAMGPVSVVAANLLTLTLQSVSSQPSTQVVIKAELTDARGVPIRGFDSFTSAFVSSSVATTDADGYAALNLTPNEQITPAGTYYTLTFGNVSVRVSKSLGNETLADALQ